MKRTILPRLGRWSEPRRVLDLGTGSGDIAAALARAAGRHGAPLRIVGLDLKLRHLVIGRRTGTEPRWWALIAALTLPTAAATLAPTSRLFLGNGVVIAITLGILLNAGLRAALPDERDRD